MTYAAKLGLEIFTLADSLFSRPSYQLRKLDFRFPANCWPMNSAIPVLCSHLVRFPVESKSADFSSSLSLMNYI